MFNLCMEICHNLMVQESAFEGNKLRYISELSLSVCLCVNITWLDQNDSPELTGGVW